MSRALQWIAKSRFPLIVFALMFTGAARAAEVGTVRLGDDYAQFYIGGTDYRPCENECKADASCQSWTYITATGQCRLKHSVVAARPNACCVSGVKAAEPAKPAKPSPVNTDATYCATWTTEALAANDRNLTGRCGLAGPLWSSSYKVLNSHCLDSSPRRRDRDAADRTDALQACTEVSVRSNSLACDHYGRMAVAEAQTNVANRCGFAGPAWSGAIQEHVRFCQSAPPSRVRDETASRERQLLECLNRGGGSIDQICDAYAVQAVSQFVQSTREKCGAAFAGPQWTDDRGQHYRWCRTHAPAERDRETKARAAALARCGEDRSRFKLIFKF